MSGTKKANESDGGPAVLRFTARLAGDPKAAKSGTGTVLEIPKPIAAKLRGMTRLEGIINGHPFRAPLEPGEPASLTIRVNQAMLRGARARAGDTVRLAVLGPEPPPAAPADLRAAFEAMPQAQAMWQELEDDVRRDWIRWIDATKNPETRVRRIRRTVEQLAERKRRPCCVNFYEYMLQRVGAEA